MEGAEIEQPAASNNVVEKKASESGEAQAQAQAQKRKKET